MPVRYAAALAVPPDLGGSAAPPGVEPRLFALTLVDDVLELLSDLALVRPALVVAPDPADRRWADDVAELVWPGTPVLPLAGPDVRAADPAERGEPIEPGQRAPVDAVAALALLATSPDLGADEVVIVAGDCPDLPQLLLAKLFRALGSAEAAICPAEGGGLVALAARTPLPAWLTAVEVSLDDPDALRVLAAAAPSRAALRVGPGWRRLRAPADIGRLDPGLEGWAATRALLTCGSPAGRGSGSL